MWWEVAVLPKYLILPPILDRVHRLQRQGVMKEIHWILWPPLSCDKASVTAFRHDKRAIGVWKFRKR